MEAPTETEIVDSKESKKHLTLRIGVTGHRNLENENLIRNGVKIGLQCLKEIHDREYPNSTYTFIIISPLAEGADRLVVHEILQMNGYADKNCTSFLEVIIPMPEQFYIQDFTTLGSVDEFYSLIGKSRVVKTLDFNGNRDEAFENVGYNVVHSCDVLFVIWNGKKAEGRGGTAEVFEYAKKVGRSYIWINSETGAIQEKQIDYDKLLTYSKTY